MNCAIKKKKRNSHSKRTFFPRVAEIDTKLEMEGFVWRLTLNRNQKASGVFSQCTESPNPRGECTHRPRPNNEEDAGMRQASRTWHLVVTWRTSELWWIQTNRLSRIQLTTFGIKSTGHCIGQQKCSPCLTSEDIRNDYDVQQNPSFHIDYYYYEEL